MVSPYDFIDFSDSASPGERSSEREGRRRRRIERGAFTVTSVSTVIHHAERSALGVPRRRPRRDVARERAPGRATAEGDRQTPSRIASRPQEPHVLARIWKRTGSPLLRVWVERMRVQHRGDGEAERARCLVEHTKPQQGEGGSRPAAKATGAAPGASPRRGHARAVSIRGPASSDRASRRWSPRAAAGDRGRVLAGRRCAAPPSTRR